MKYQTPPGWTRTREGGKLRYVNPEGKVYTYKSFIAACYPAEHAADLADRRADYFEKPRDRMELLPGWTRLCGDFYQSPEGKRVSRSTYNRRHRYNQPPGSKPSTLRRYAEYQANPLAAPLDALWFPADKFFAHLEENMGSVDEWHASISESHKRRLNTWRREGWVRFDAADRMLTAFGLYIGLLGEPILNFPVGRAPEGVLSGQAA